MILKSLDYRTKHRQSGGIILSMFLYFTRVDWEPAIGGSNLKQLLVDTESLHKGFEEICRRLLTSPPSSHNDFPNNRRMNRL